MLVCPQNDILITIEKKHQDKIGNLYVATNWSPEEHVTITGRVVSLPKRIANERVDFRGYTAEGIQVGDMLLFRYDVVHHFSLQKEGYADTHKYELFYQGKSYWRCSIIKTFAYIRDGQINMINGYVMLEPPQSQPTSLILPHHMKTIPRTNSAIVSHIGRPLTHLKPIDVAPGDEVCFDTKKVQHYQIGGKPFMILKQSQIFGKEINSV